MLIDTHCHIHDRDTYDFALSRQQIGKKLIRRFPSIPRVADDFTPDKIIARAHKNGVMQMICIGTSHQDSMVACTFSKNHQKDGVFWSYGIHPDEAESNYEELESLSKLPLLPVAIGEIGLDYCNIKDTPSTPDSKKVRTAQIRLFEQMLALAVDNHLPAIFHVRDAYEDFFAVLRNFPKAIGVVHSFSDTRENLEKSLNSGFYIGVNGLATFATEIPLPPVERMLLETDAPFLTPEPFRGTINEPAHIKDICANISVRLKITEEELEGRTTENARQLFKLSNASL
ncbi:TatD family hydrolase [Candidatus Saccharibacteria bacterium]|nr:TatD family hydrolase [Candidatus Saccharibacteria bacterium]